MKNRCLKCYPLFVAVIMVAGASRAAAQHAAADAAVGVHATAESAAELAKKLQNPVAAMISFPLQANFDWGAGPSDAGFQMRINVQPVIPIGLSDGWNLISRTILPIVYQDEVTSSGSQAGLGDTTQSLFVSPSAPLAGWILGVGPAFLLPTATDSVLGTQKWGIGPTAIVLRQDVGFTYGMLFNHIWSFAGSSSRQDVSSTFLQPFVSYTTKTFTTFALNTETTYDWENEQWTVPLNLIASQLIKLGSLPLQLAIGGRYYAEKAENGPEWGLRFVVTFLLPK
jgi:hypothetical protein